MSDKTTNQAEFIKPNAPNNKPFFQKKLGVLVTFLVPFLILVVFLLGNYISTSTELRKAASTDLPPCPQPGSCAEVSLSGGYACAYQSGGYTGQAWCCYGTDTADWQKGVCVKQVTEILPTTKPTATPKPSSTLPACSPTASCAEVPLDNGTLCQISPQGQAWCCAAGYTADWQKAVCIKNSGGILLPSPTSVPKPTNTPKPTAKPTSKPTVAPTTKPIPTSPPDTTPTQAFSYQVLYLPDKSRFAFVFSNITQAIYTQYFPLNSAGQGWRKTSLINGGPKLPIQFFSASFSENRATLAVISSDGKTLYERSGTWNQNELAFSNWSSWTTQ